MKITKEGFAKLQDTLKDLKEVQRPKIIKAIADAREHGDLKENAEYHAAKDKQGFVEAQIADYESKYNSAEVIDVATLDGDIVVFGSTVELEDLDDEKIRQYKIVSEFEADIDQGMISDASPVARKLIGKKVGDEVEIKVPKGLANYEIINLYFK